MPEKKPRRRRRPDVVVRTPSPNHYTGRTGFALIVLHSTESFEIPKSDRDLAGIAAYFAKAGGVAAQVITDGDGHSARCVRDADSAWACVAFNRVSLNVEQIGHAAQTSWPDAQLDETARWLAVWHKRHGIPLRRGAVSGSSVTTPGVVTHAQLGAAGGGHSDPGTHYPVDEVIRRAIAFAK